MINSRNDIVSLLKEYIVTQQEYVYQFWMPEAHEWNVKKQVAYYNGIVLGKFREKDAFTLQVLKEGVTDQALYDEIKINLERHIKMIEGLEQPDIMNKMQMESYKRQRDELSRDTIDDWISNYCRWIQEDVMEISYSEIRVLLFIYYSFDNYDYQRKHPFCSDLNELEVVYKGNLDKQNQFFKYGIVPVDDERELLPIEPPRIYDRKINKTFFTKNVPLNLLEKIADMMSSGIVRDFSVRLLNEPGYNGKLYCEYIAEALERGKVFDFVNLGNYSISRLYSKEYENCMWVVIDPQNITFEELCKVIMECINNFMGNLNISISGIGRKMLETWHWQVFDNGGKKDSAIKLTKKDIIWPILVQITEIEQCEDSFLEQFDSGVYEEVVNRYSEVINSHCEQCEFFIKVLSDYNNFKTEKKQSEKLNEFIEIQWKDYISEFAVDGVEEEIQEALAKIVIHNIIKRRFTIDRIKKGVKLC